MGDITVSEDMLISAVRYALTRSTWIVAATVNQTIKVWPHLSPRAQQVIISDVTAEIEAVISLRANRIDANEWKRLIDHIEAHHG